MVRAAAKNHANVAIVTSPARYDDRPRRARDRTGRSATGCARALARRGVPRTPPPTTRGSPSRAAGPDGGSRRGAARRAGPARSERSVPATPDDRPREGRDPALRREPAPAGRPLPAPRSTARRTGPFATGEPPLQGKALSYNNVLDASAAAALGRALRGPACVDRQAHQPVRRRGTADAPRGVGGGARRRPGLGLRRRGRADPRRSTRRSPTALDLDLPRGRRRAGVRRRPRSTILAAKPNLRLVVDPALADGRRPRRPRIRPGRSGRPAAPSWSRRPTRRPTTRRPGPWRRAAPRPTPSCSTSTSPGASFAA